jgi:hypothetical protein
MTNNDDNAWWWNVHYTMIDIDAPDSNLVCGPYTLDEAVERRRKMAEWPRVINAYLARADLKSRS